MYNVRLNQPSQNSNQKLCDTKVINCSETENQIYCPPVKCADLSSYVGRVTQKSICSNQRETLDTNRSEPTCPIQPPCDETLLKQSSQISNQKLCETKVTNCSETENQVHCPSVKCADLSSQTNVYVGHVTLKSLCSNRKECLDINRSKPTCPNQHPCGENLLKETRQNSNHK